ncbi:MAG: arginine--tRNA ligase [Actinomycetia bacterium]|nr:arginine--tRNA ligase [Actinomycetes bacterium]
MIIKDLSSRLSRYIGQMEAEGTEEVLDSVTIGVPKNRKFGDLFTNAAMVLAKPLRKNPMLIADQMIEQLEPVWEQAENMEVVKPGFINFRLKDEFIKSRLADIGRLTGDYGRNREGDSVKVNIEYVSSNPTGNLHIGHGRWGVLGDVLARLYAANGYQVTREYYVNDYGTQIQKFGQCAVSLYRSHFGQECVYPEDGYPREAVLRVVESIIEKQGSRFLEDIKDLEKSAVDAMVGAIRDTLSSMGVDFDVWFKESSLYQDKNFEKVIDKLEKKDLAYSSEGALWFRSSDYGDEKDRVIVRKEGQPTYFASDIMYLMNKAERGFDRLFYILGADHHGYVDRLKATARALGLQKAELNIIIGQLVRLVKSGKPVKMSRRKGKVYTLSDLIDEVGRDAVRYFFAANSFDTPMDFDIDLAKQKSNQNPVFYVQYAHARIESILDKVGRELSMEDIDSGMIDFSSETEREIAKKLIFFPDEVYNGCVNNAPYFLTQYLYGLASDFHYFYNHYRIMEGEKINTRRLALVLLTKQVLVNGLDMLGISAPSKM